MINIFELSLEQLEDHLVGLGKQKFRAQQMFRWLYAHGVRDWESMTNLSKPFRSELPRIFDLSLPRVHRRLDSVDGTKKFLFELQDGLTVESVLIPAGERRTLCVSSEVGCNLGCRFCFTGKQKLKRRLTTSEIVGQFLQVQALVSDRITNVVFMGMGEPLDNPEAVFGAIEILQSDWGINLSRKRITVSTAGLVPRIPLVTQSGARLAVSLNGVDDEIRSRLMPINQRWPINQLMEACYRHAIEAKDKITFEYVLLKGLTDSLDDARRLVKLVNRVPNKINIIPFNEHPNSGFHRPEESQVQAFQEELMRRGAHVLRRQTKGRDVYAACGQLTSAIAGHPERMSV